jgi:hypothetical protein
VLGSLPSALCLSRHTDRRPGGSLIARGFPAAIDLGKDTRPEVRTEGL